MVIEIKLTSKAFLVPVRNSSQFWPDSGAVPDTALLKKQGTPEAMLVYSRRKSMLVGVWSKVGGISGARSDLKAGLITSDRSRVNESNFESGSWFLKASDYQIHF